MLPHNAIRSLASQIYNARKTRTLLRHFSQRFAAMTAEDGYAIHEWVKLELSDSCTIKGPKIGPALRDTHTRAPMRHMHVHTQTIGPVRPSN
jgi:2-keto-4-pentenoate hydratase